MEGMGRGGGHTCSKLQVLAPPPSTSCMTGRRECGRDPPSSPGPCQAPGALAQRPVPMWGAPEVAETTPCIVVTWVLFSQGGRVTYLVTPPTPKYCTLFVRTCLPPSELYWSLRLSCIWDGPSVTVFTSPIQNAAFTEYGLDRGGHARKNMEDLNAFPNAQFLVFWKKAPLSYITNDGQRVLAWVSASTAAPLISASTQVAGGVLCRRSTLHAAACSHLRLSEPKPTPSASCGLSHTSMSPARH